MKTAMVKRWAGICELPPEKMQEVIDVIEGDNYAIVPNNDWAAVAKFSALRSEDKKKIMSFIDG